MKKSDNLYSIFSADDIWGMEIKILWALDFCLRQPSSLNFLRHNSKVGSVSAEHHNLAKLAMELALTEYRLAHIMPSKLAAAALLLAMRVVDNAKNFSSIWTPNLEYYSGYNVDTLQPTCVSLSEAQLTMET